LPRPTNNPNRLGKRTNRTTQGRKEISLIPLITKVVLEPIKRILVGRVSTRNLGCTSLNPNWGTLVELGSQGKEKGRKEGLIHQNPTFPSVGLNPTNGNHWEEGKKGQEFKHPSTPPGPRELYNRSLSVQ